MPGDFICQFAYEFSKNSLNDIEDYLQKLYKKERINGEWFLINVDQLFAVEAVCEKKGGKLITKKVEHEIESQTEVITHKTSQIHRTKNQKDHKQYKFNGMFYGKGRLVLAIVKDYIKNHTQCTYDELEDIFYKELQGSVGVIGKYEEEEKNTLI